MQRLSSWSSVLWVRASGAGSRRLAALLTLVGWLGGSQPASLASSVGDDPKSAEYFEARVRPLLLSRCGECHGETAEGGLRLDSREGLIKGGRSGPAILPGDPNGSLLVQAVRHSHPRLRMPKGRSKLADFEADGLGKWIDVGAPWPTAAPRTPVAPGQPSNVGRELWSLRPIARPAIPELEGDAWPRSDIDRFVLNRLKREGLRPVGTTEKRVLIRRATLDLTGLPPSREEVEAFLADSSPEAFAKVVDRLLSSPQYGEMWARWWLDVARYGEDDCRSLDPKNRGYNPYPYAYAYRDWIVQAINDDVPYDTFVIAQIAADLLPEGQRVSMLPALGFLGLGPWLYDNGSVEVTRADERHDRVDTISRGLVGLTIGCARCHDHKYDAISTADYYGLAGVFKNTVYREYPRVPKSVVDEHERLEKRSRELESLVEDFEKAERRRVAGLFAMQTSKYLLGAWSVLGEPKREKAEVVSKEGLDYEVFDRWLALLGKPPRHYRYLEPWRAMIAGRGKKEEAQKVADRIQEAVLDVMLEEIRLEQENDIIRAKALPGTTKKQKANLPHEFVTNDDFCPGCGLELKTMKGERNSFWIDLFHHDLDKQLDLAQEMFTSHNPGVFSFEGKALERHLSSGQRQFVEGLRDEVKRIQKQLEPKYPYLHGVADATNVTPIQIHMRGSPFRLGADVPSRLPSLLETGSSGPFVHGSGRLELAQALAAHPISSRVIVNRVWKWHFGTGIVETPGDFGITGEQPSNPELLEYLAWLFVDCGKSLKKLHREIMLSATYQLADTHSETNAAIDASNRLYWRFDGRRLTAEQIRDSLLFVSGSLDLTMGGPSQKLTSAEKRRTLYGQVSRFQLDGFLALFDFPAPNTSAERRFTTQVPQQRLFLMNSEFMQQQAELLVRRVASETNETRRIQKAYSLLFARDATESELSRAREFLRTEPMTAYAERKAATHPEVMGLSGASVEPGGLMGTRLADGGVARAPVPESDSGKSDRPDSESRSGGEEAKPAEKLLPVTIEGRLFKTLMSSHEFLFLR